MILDLPYVHDPLEEDKAEALDVMDSPFLRDLEVGWGSIGIVRKNPQGSIVCISNNKLEDHNAPENSKEIQRDRGGSSGRLAAQRDGRESPRISQEGSQAILFRRRAEHDL